MTSFRSTPSTIRNEWKALLAGGDASLRELFLAYRDRLERTVHRQLDRRIAGRVDPADVVQESFMEIGRRLHHLESLPAVSPYVWLRQITRQTMLDVHRRHLNQKRNASHERSLYQRVRASTMALPVVRHFSGTFMSPSQALVRKERSSLLRRAINRMEEKDREILVLRHFRQLTNGDAAKTLGISTKAASNRHARALQRLRSYLDAHGLD